MVDKLQTVTALSHIFFLMKDLSLKDTKQRKSLFSISNKWLLETIFYVSSLASLLRVCLCTYFGDPLKA